MSRHERTLNLTALYRGVTPVHFDPARLMALSRRMKPVNLLRDKGYLVSARHGYRDSGRCHEHRRFTNQYHAYFDRW